jgi:hypothetical protein
VQGDDEDAERPLAVDVTPERRHPSAVREERGDADDRHHRLGPDGRHERERQQKPRAVTGKPAHDRGGEGDAGDGEIMPEGNAKKGRLHRRHRPFVG